MTRASAERHIVGWREWVSLPELNVPVLKAKIDTGARTSALHVCDLSVSNKNGKETAFFKLHPIQKRSDLVIECQAEVVDRRVVRDSGGHSEERVVIMSKILLGCLEWPVEITLANREDMLFRMLLARTAIGGRFVVDSSKSFVYGSLIQVP